MWKEERSNAVGERRADVMVTHMPSHVRIAFEIQYASLRPDKMAGAARFVCRAGLNRPGFHAAVLLAASIFIGPFVSEE